MKRLIVILSALTIAVIAALFAKVDPGYVMMAYGKWSLETSAILLGLILIISFTVLYYAIRFFVNVGQIPKRTRDWSSQRKKTKANNELSTGLVEIAEGRYDEAQKTLTRHPNDSMTPTINYLAAARAASASGAYQKRDDFLALAHKNAPQDDFAIELTKAELYIDEGRQEDALAIVEHLRQGNPKNHHVLQLLTQLYRQFNNLQQLKELLPELRKLKSMTDEERSELSVYVYRSLIDDSNDKDTLSDVMNTWAGIPKEYKNNSSILMSYATILIKHNAGDTAEPLLREAINRCWDTQLVTLYGKLERGDTLSQLKHAESWITGHENDPSLMLTLGRLCLRCQLWGKAREYLEASVNNNGHATAFYLLAKLLDSLGEKEKALELYQSGLAVVVDETDFEFPNAPEQKDVDDLETQARLKIIS